MSWKQVMVDDSGRWQIALASEPWVLYRPRQLFLGPNGLSAHAFAFANLEEAQLAVELYETERWTELSALDFVPAIAIVGQVFSTCFDYQLAKIPANVSDPLEHIGKPRFESQSMNMLARALGVEVKPGWRIDVMATIGSKKPRVRWPETPISIEVEEEIKRKLKVALVDGERVACFLKSEIDQESAWEYVVRHHPAAFAQNNPFRKVHTERYWAWYAKE